MKYINLTVHTQDDNFQLLQGKPVDHGMESTRYIVLSNDYAEIHVWLVGAISETERHRITQGVMTYLETTMNVSNLSTRQASLV